MLDKESKKDYYFIYCIVLIVVSLPLLGIDAYRGHDTGFHIQRIISIRMRYWKDGFLLEYIQRQSMDMAMEHHYFIQIFFFIFRHYCAL